MNQDSADRSKLPEARRTHRCGNATASESLAKGLEQGNAALREGETRAAGLAWRCQRSFMTDVPASEVVYQTFAFLLEDLVAANPDLDPVALRSLRLVFDRTEKGVIILDGIGFLPSRQESEIKA